MKINRTISAYITIMFALCLDGHSPENKLMLSAKDRKHIDTILDELTIAQVIHYQAKATTLLQDNKH